MANLPTYFINDDAVAARTVDIPNADWSGGMNRSASCANGIGIATDNVNPKEQDWPLEQLIYGGNPGDPVESTLRDPQGSSHIGGSGLGDGDNTDNSWTVVRAVSTPDQEMNFLIADQAADPGEVFNTSEGLVNLGTTRIEIGDRAWGGLDA